MRKVYLFLFCLIISSCDFNQTDTKRDLPKAEAKDTLILTTDSIVDVPKAEELKIRYHSIPVNMSFLDSLEFYYNSDQLWIIYSLNRIDKDHFWKEDSLIIPDTFLFDRNVYSPFPDSLSELKNIKKLIIFSYRIQAFAVYEEGQLRRWGPVSMGKRSTPTPVGLYSTNWKAKETISTVDEGWVMKWYFNIVNFQGVSMHEYDLPGYPASHACVRLLEEDAKWFYEWADQWVLSELDRIIAYGTPVFIYGEYNFDKPKPWKELTLNSTATDENADSIVKWISPFNQLIIERQIARDSVNKLQTLVDIK